MGLFDRFKDFLNSSETIVFTNDSPAPSPTPKPGTIVFEADKPTPIGPQKPVSQSRPASMIPLGPPKGTPQPKPHQPGGFQWASLFKPQIKLPVLFNRPAATPAPTPTPRPMPKITQKNIQLFATPKPQSGRMEVRPGSVQGATDTDFTTLMDVFAQKAIEQGFHPATLVSQMAVESQRGKSRFARERNNYFGLGAYTHDPNNAFTYDSPEAAMDYYLNLIATDPRYSSAYAVRHDPYAYLEELIKVPYATDPNYFDLITNTPEFRQYNTPEYANMLGR